jgi:hypothetical protein
MLQYSLIKILIGAIYIISFLFLLFYCSLFEQGLSYFDLFPPNLNPIFSFLLFFFITLSKKMNTEKNNNKDSRPRTPNNNTATYRDLVIFEERLRGNMTRLLKRKRKYESKSNIIN